jgi:acetolactate synthase-1/2/3 large subunit
VKDVADLPRIPHEAFHIATSGRPVRWSSIPKDVQFAKGVYQARAR